MMEIVATIIQPFSQHHLKKRKISIKDKLIVDISEYAVDERCKDIICEQFIMPGLINAHIHYYCRSDSCLFSSGITAIRDMGMPFVTFKILQKLVSLDGVTRNCSGPILTCNKGYPLNFSNGKMGLNVQSENDAKEKMQCLIVNSVDFIKISLTKGPNLNWPMLGKVEVATIINEAENADKKVVAHIDSVHDLMYGFKLGVRDFAHIPTQDRFHPAQVKELVKNNVYICSTMTPYKIRAQKNKECRQPYENAKYNLKIYYDHGGKLTIGNDFGTGVVPHPALFDEIEEVYDIINDADYVLNAVSEGNARASGLHQQIGKIELNMVADLICLNKNPLIDMRNLRKITKVIKAGNIVAMVD